ETGQRLSTLTRRAAQERLAAVVVAWSAAQTRTTFGPWRNGGAVVAAAKRALAWDGQGLRRMATSRARRQSTARALTGWPFTWIRNRRIPPPTSVAVGATRRMPRRLPGSKRDPP